MEKILQFLQLSFRYTSSVLQCIRPSIYCNIDCIMAFQEFDRKFQDWFGRKRMSTSHNQYRRIDTTILCQYLRCKADFAYFLRYFNFVMCICFIIFYFILPFILLLQLHRDYWCKIFFSQIPPDNSLVLSQNPIYPVRV
jgi:hypothetical protein